MDREVNTLEVAGSLLRSSMRLHICRRMAEERPDVWEPMVMLSSSFVDDARKGWEDVLRRWSPDETPTLLGIILNALIQARADVGIPYSDYIPQKRMDELVQEYLDQFDPSTLVSMAEGSDESG